ncbi:hypothetical protein PG991_008890 [Apiospora marii]|uniref:Uncharacterized protein n=1 Tax=Apiospora marii TaxID=335849 RepID=A0ABR1RMB9_9PEZI
MVVPARPSHHHERQIRRDHRRRRRYIAFCDAASAASHQLALKAKLGTPAGWMVRGYARAANGHYPLTFAEEESLAS